MSILLKITLILISLAAYNLFLKQLLIHQDFQISKIKTWVKESYESKNNLIKQNNEEKQKIISKIHLEYSGKEFPLSQINVLIPHQKKHE